MLLPSTSPSPRWASSRIFSSGPPVHEYSLKVCLKDELRVKMHKSLVVSVHHTDLLEN